MKKIDFYKLIIIFLVLLNTGTLIMIWVNQPIKTDSKLTAPPPAKQNEREPQIKGTQSANDNLVTDLALNKEQQNKYLEFKNKHHENELRLHESLRELKKRYFDLLSDNKAADASTIAQQIGNIEKERVMNTFNYFRDIRMLCDNEQKDRFDHVYRDALRMLNGPPRK
jgi:hypothetical protein